MHQLTPFQQESIHQIYWKLQMLKAISMTDKSQSQMGGIPEALPTVLETWNTTTRATTMAYRKQIFCSGHGQKLNNWLQPAVVFTLATPHSLFWRSVDNVIVYCKVFSPFFDLPLFFVRHIMKDLSGVYCQTFFEEKFYNEHPWGRKIR